MYIEIIHSKHQSTCRFGLAIERICTFLMHAADIKFATSYVCGAELRNFKTISIAVQKMILS